MGTTVILSGFKLGYGVNEKDKLSIATAIHVNKILDLVNEKATEKLFSPAAVMQDIKIVMNKYGIGQEVAAKLLRGAVEKHYRNGTLHERVWGVSR